VAVQLNLLDSHDMPRFLSLARGDLSALRLATLFQMTYTGAPSIYYGDEIGMRGGHDPANRGAFPWYSSETWDKSLLHDFQRLIALRKSRPALRRGSFKVLHAHDDVFVYARQLGNETVVVALNVSASSKRVDVPLEGLLSDGAGLDEVWAHESVKAEAGALRGLRLGPRSGRVFATPPP
jgi:neopullulanase